MVTQSVRAAAQPSAARFGAGAGHIQGNSACQTVETSPGVLTEFVVQLGLTAHRWVAGRNFTTMPISSTNSSFYDPKAQYSPADGLAPSGTSAPSPEAPLREVTISPVVITAEPGAQQLVRKYDAASKQPDCALEANNAALSCAKAAVTAVGGALLSTTVVAIAVSAAATLAEAISCGKDFRTYYDCDEQ